MHGIHPDVVFAEARLRLGCDPYVSAMEKFRGLNEGRIAARKRREMLLLEPEKYGLTDAEIKAVKRIK